MNQTASYKERKKFEIYDKDHALLYLNEQEVEIIDKESGEAVPGFSYTGNMPDGGTLVEASGVTEANRRDKFVAGVIGLHYDMDAQIAVLANGADTPEHAGELADFMAVRTEAKAKVDEMLNR